MAASRPPWRATSPAQTSAPSRRPVRGPDDFAERFAVSRETLERMQTYADLLVRWQKTINLVAPSTIPSLWDRHMADSAQLLALAPPTATSWLDLGSGAGFPGLVVAIMARGCGGPLADCRFTLIESDGRKAAFLREVARTTGVAVDIVVERIESRATLDTVTPASCISARALAPLQRLLGWVAPYFGHDSVGLFLKGREAASELLAAEQDWSFASELLPSQTDPTARIVLLRALKARTKG